MSKPRKPTTPQGRGPIEKDALYPVSVFTRKLGLGRHSMTALRRRGLPIHSIGQRLFVDGREAITFFRDAWRDDDAPGGPERIQEELS